MPDISKITDVLYDGNQPYHVHFDNLPLKNILTRIDLVNAQVDINSDILRGACGTVGTLSNRLSVGIRDDGKLKPSAIDDSLHNIGAHEDGTYDGVEYVRMTQSERDKLSNIQPGSNNLELEVEDSISSETQVDHVVIYNGNVKLKASDTIAFQFIAPDTIKAHSKYTLQAAHVHNYQIVPAHTIPSSPDYQNYKTTSVNTAFKEGSLRVYVNGFRLSSSSSVIVLVGDNPLISESWKNLYVQSQSHTQGTFSLSQPINSDSVILIDFDQSLI
jgi:hypothetical protein